MRSGWVCIKEHAHKRVLLMVLIIGFTQGAAFGFGVCYLVWR